MTKTEFLEEMDTVLNAEPGSTSMDTELQFGGWDSMAIVVFLAMVDDKLGMTLAYKDIAACKKVSDLAGICNISNE